MHSIIPQPGLGTFRLKDEIVIASVRSALELGYRHIDTAKLYDNESAVGRAVVSSGIDRSELFVTTKVWFDSLDADGVIESLQQSLSRLQMSYVDLALIHWPSPNNAVPMAHYIGKLNQAREMGLTRHIGISNFTIAQVDQALACAGGEHIVTNQIEVHPFLRNQQLVEHCQARGLTVTGYMPLAVGKVMDDPVLQAIASNHGATPAQIALAWVVSKNIVVIPSSTKSAHQQSNLNALKIQLSDAEIARIDALDSGDRIANPDFAPNWD
ncbi:2,5-didehydrogluconate reductase DkgB [Gilvimarinus sp. SDUM040013]|uniref:2,5-didehydrogluconate reductase DkgB n=1 Tax=Gilvimarinus gilvus TaxID=3058038 RepID=A0ABU4RZV0_9GAMM|nr:2,5-didehydrogluconate reductase DkgB [Gilvimarinus sp. SDUM040013]MDO3386562.1 2,5-didehydrogluconate reductase DkgB [Gilvimarinus sp. SDUM040013]MDX6849138.1 2,5-didehydrogluconate reductase DkgB [Gilvimarinus sp. SDUM040013]